MVLYYEAQIQNLCANSIYIQSISISNKNEDSKETFYYPLRFSFNLKIYFIFIQFSNDDLLEPQSIRQFIFPLMGTINEKQGNNSSEIYRFGNLSINWITTMGDRGKIMLDTLQRPVFKIIYKKRHNNLILEFIKLSQFIFR